MRGLTFVSLAAKSLLNRLASVTLTVMAIALSVTLFLGVEKLRAGAYATFTSTISGTDLIVGARGGEVNLLLYAVFHIGAATNNITWDSYQAIKDRDDVAWAVPISLGDSHRGYRVVGTTPDYFTRYRHGRDQALRFAQGGAFEDVFDAVLGAEVADALGYEMGDRIVVAHGIGATSFALHDTMPFTVTGILAPTGTPVDRTVMVGLDGIEAIHLGWEGGTRSAAADAVDLERVRALDLTPDAVTAVLVGMTTRMAVLRAQREINTYRAEPLLAVIPGVALAQLWSVVGVAEGALSAIAAFVVFTGLLGMATSILTGLNERRREMAILRSVGARPWHIFALLLTEVALLALAGSLLGLAIVYGALALGAPLVAASYGIPVGLIGPGWYDGAVVLGVVAAALALGCVPAWRAYRQSLADGLTIRI